MKPCVWTSNMDEEYRTQMGFYFKPTCTAQFVGWIPNNYKYCPYCSKEIKKQVKLEFKPIPPYGDHITWKYFVDAVNDGAFVDYDGHGNLATETEVSPITIHPSDIFEKEFPEWATHVVWYNK